MAYIQAAHIPGWQGQYLILTIASTMYQEQLDLAKTEDYVKAATKLSGRTTEPRWYRRYKSDFAMPDEEE